MRKTRKALLASAVALGAVAGTAGPALAGTTFAVTDNGGVLVTRYPLTAGEVFYCGGTEYKVQSARDSYGTDVIEVTPGFPASDAGKTVACTT